MKITYVQEPLRHEPLPCQAPADEYHSFVEAIGKHAGVMIPRIDAFLRDVLPLDGFIILESTFDPALVIAECATHYRADLQSRLVPIGLTNERVLESILEELSLPAAVDSTTMSEWKPGGNPNRPGAWGPYGRRDVAALVGATCFMEESERYCYMRSTHHEDVPHLLADYLAAWPRRPA